MFEFSSRKGRKIWKKHLKGFSDNERQFAIKVAIDIYGQKRDEAEERIKNATNEQERLDAEYDSVMYYEYICYFAKIAERDMRKKWFKRCFNYEMKNVIKKFTP